MNAYVCRHDMFVLASRYASSEFSEFQVCVVPLRILVLRLFRKKTAAARPQSREPSWNRTPHGSSSKGRDVSGALTKQTTQSLDRNPRWQEVIAAPQIENPQECAGKTVLVEGSLWETCSEEEETEEYECRVLRYVCHELEPFYPDRHCNDHVFF